MRYKSRLFSSRYLKNVGILISGSAVAQVIVVAVSPVLTRIFPVEELGLYTYFLSIAQTFMAVICLRYDVAIVFEKDERTVLSLIKLSILISICLSFLVSIGFGIYFAFSLNEYADNSLLIVIFLFFLLLSYGVINVLTAYNNRQEEYRVMTRVYIIRTAFQNLGAVLLGWLSPAALSLMLPYAAGQLFGIKAQGKPLRGRWKEILSVPSGEMRKTASLHRRQPLFSSPALFANSFSYSSVTLFIQTLFDFRIVGFYSMSVRVLGLPISLISGNIAKVFFKQAADEFNQSGRYWNAFRKTLLLMTALAVPMVLVIILAAPAACRVFFGVEWEIAGEYMRVLAPMFGARFVMTTLSPGLQVCGRQKAELVLQLILVFASVISFVFAKTMSLSVIHYLQIVNWLKFAVFMLFIFVIGKFSIGKKKEASRLYEAG